MTRKIDDVNCVIDVLIIYNLQKNTPNIHSPMCIVKMRIGRPIKKISSANAKLRM